MLDVPAISSNSSLRSCFIFTEPLRGGVASQGDWRLTVGVVEGSTGPRLCTSGPGEELCLIWTFPSNFVTLSA